MILLLNVMRNNKLTARIFLTQKRINLVVFFSSSSSPERDEAAVVSFSKSRSHEIVFFFYNVIHCNRPQNVWCGCCCFLFFFFFLRTNNNNNKLRKSNEFFSIPVLLFTIIRHFFYCQSGVTGRFV